MYSELEKLLIEMAKDIPGFDRETPENSMKEFIDMIWKPLLDRRDKFLQHHDKLTPEQAEAKEKNDRLIGVVYNAVWSLKYMASYRALVHEYVADLEKKACDYGDEVGKFPFEIIGSINKLKTRL